MRTLTAHALQSKDVSASITFARACSLSSGATASSRSRKTRSAPSVGAFSMARTFVPGTASSLRCSRFLTATDVLSVQDVVERVEHAVCRLAVRVHSHQPDPPDRRSGGAEAAADLDAVTAEELRLDLLAVDPLRNPDRGELRELKLRIGEEVEPSRADAALEVRAGVVVARPARLHALLEAEAESLVQRVVLQDRQRVVIGDRPLDPVLLEQLEVEAVRGGVLAPADPLQRALGERYGRDPRRAAERLLRAGVRIVHAPGGRLELLASQ